MHKVTTSIKIRSTCWLVILVLVFGYLNYWHFIPIKVCFHTSFLGYLPLPTWIISLYIQIHPSTPEFWPNYPHNDFLHLFLHSLWFYFLFSNSLISSLFSLTDILSFSCWNFSASPVQFFCVLCSITFPAVLSFSILHSCTSKTP